MKRKNRYILSWTALLAAAGLAWVLIAGRMENQSAWDRGKDRLWTLEEWREEADRRIDTYRTSDFVVNVEDATGRKCNAKVQVELLKQDFVFGTAISVEDILQRPECIPAVTDFLNTVTIENALKMPAWTGEWGDGFGQDRTEQAVSMLKDKGMKVVGHTLVWPSFEKNGYGFGQRCRDDPEKLAREIDDFIKDLVGRFKGKIDSWDVVNEMYRFHEFSDMLDRDRDRPYSAARWFGLCREIDPGAGLAYNDYWYLGDEEHLRYVEQLVGFLKRVGRGPDVLGIQAYFDYDEAPEIQGLWDSFQECYERTGLPMKVSEYNLFWPRAGEHEVYLYTKDFVRAVYADPHMEGFIGWTDTGVIPSRAPGLFNEDYSLTPSGRAVRDLLTMEWVTREKGRTWFDGAFGFHGFDGTYEITVTKGMRKWVFREEMNRTSPEITLRLGP